MQRLLTLINVITLEIKVIYICQKTCLFIPKNRGSILLKSLFLFITITTLIFHMVKLSEVKVGDLVVVGLSGYPRWPAFVVDPSWIPENENNSQEESIRQKNSSLPSSDNSRRTTRRSSVTESSVHHERKSTTDTMKSRRSSTAEISKNRRRSSRLNDGDSLIDSLIELSTTIFQDEKKPVMFINDECYMYISGRQIKYLTKEMCESFIEKYKPLIENNVSPSLWRLPGNIKRYFPQILGAYELAYCYLQNPQVSLTEIPSILSSKLYNDSESVVSQNDMPIRISDSKLYGSFQSVNSKTEKEEEEEAKEEKKKKEEEEEEISPIKKTRSRRTSYRVVNDDDDTEIEKTPIVPVKPLLQEKNENHINLDKSLISGTSEVEEISYDEMMSSSEFLSEIHNENTQNSFIRKCTDTIRVPTNFCLSNENIMKDELEYEKQKYSFEMPKTEKRSTITVNLTKAEPKLKSSSSSKEPSFKNILSSDNRSYFSKTRSISNQSKVLKSSINDNANNRNNSNLSSIFDSSKHSNSLKKSKYLAPHFDNILNSDDTVFPNNNKQSYSFTTSPYSSSHSFSSPEILYSNSRDSIADITNFTNSNIVNIKSSPNTLSTNDTMRIDNLINDTQISNKFSGKHDFIGETKNPMPSQLDNNNLVESSKLSLEYNSTVPTRLREFYRHTQFKEQEQKYHQLGSENQASNLSNNGRIINQEKFDTTGNRDSYGSSSDISDIESTIIKKEEEYIADLDLSDHFIFPFLKKSHPRPIYRTTFKFYPRKEDRKVSAQKTKEKIRDLEREQQRRKEMLKRERDTHNKEFYKYQVKLKLAANRLSDEETDDSDNGLSEDNEVLSQYRKRDDPEKYSEIFDSMMTLQRFSRESSTTSSPINLKRKGYDACASPVKKIKLNVSKFQVDTTDSDGFNYSVMKDQDDYMYYFYYDNPEKLTGNFKDDLTDDAKYCFGPEDVQNRVKILSHEITELLTDKFEATDSVLGEFNTKLLLIDDLMNLRIERCVAAVDNFKGIYENITPEKIAKRIVLSRKTKISSSLGCNQREKQIARQIRQFKFKSTIIQKELAKKQQTRQLQDSHRLKRVSGASTLKELADAFKLDLWIMEDIENTIKEVAKFLNITLYGKLTKYCNQTWAKRDQQVKCRFIGCLKRIFWEKFRFRGDSLLLLVKRVARLCGHYLNYRTKLMNESLHYGSSNDFDVPNMDEIPLTALNFDLRSSNEQRVSKNDLLVKLSFDQFKDDNYDTLSLSSFNSEDYKVSSDDEPQPQIAAVKPHRQRGRPPAINKTVKLVPKKRLRRGRPRRSSTQTQSVSSKIDQNHFKADIKRSKYYELPKGMKLKAFQFYENGSELLRIADVGVRKNRKGRLVLRAGNRNASTV